MTAAELRAITAQGPAVVMVARDDMLALLDELEALRRLRDLPHPDPRAASTAWADAAAVIYAAAIWGVIREAREDARADWMDR